jgi:2-dehydro-3-deoxygalactonokinase
MDPSAWLTQVKAAISKTGTFIAVDWGTSRFRAHLVDESGAIAASVDSEDGISAVAGKDFAAVLLAQCGSWLEASPGLLIVMAGMVGSRNGWREVAYAECPASIQTVARGTAEVEVKQGHRALIVPGAISRSAAASDVMRGEESLVFGLAARDATVVIPGTHSKWIEVRGGAIHSFRTFMTGEFYGLLRHQSVLRLLAGEPQEKVGFTRGLEAATGEGGLLHQAFMARTGVLDGTLRPGEVGPFLSGLVIGTEVASRAPSAGDVHVIAESDLGENYMTALAARSIKARLHSPTACLAAGLGRLVTAIGA